MILLTILIPLILGITILSLFSLRNYYFWEKLALSFCAGLGILTIIMFLMVKFGIPLTLINILIITIGLIVLISIYRLKPHIKMWGINKKNIPHTSVWGSQQPPLFTKNEILQAFSFLKQKYSAFEYFLFISISLKVLYVSFSALIKPLVDVDSFQFYSIVAKGIFYDKTFTLPYLQQFMGDKPLFPFLAQGWSFISLQSSNDALFKIIYPVLFVCFLIIFYSVLRKSYKRLYSLLFTFLLSTLPFFIYHLTTAYSDSTITIYYSIATLYLFAFMKDSEQNQENLFMAAIFTGLTIWAKKAGLVLCSVNIFVLLVYLGIKFKSIDKSPHQSVWCGDKQMWKKVIIAALLFLMVSGPWLITGQFGTIINVSKSILGLNPATETIVAQQTQPEGNYAMVLQIFLKKLFLYADWHLLWLLFIVSILFFYKNVFKMPQILLLIIIILDLLALFLQFGTGETFKWLLDGTLLDRLVMPITPVALLFCATAIIPGLKDNLSES